MCVEIVMFTSFGLSDSNKHQHSNLFQIMLRPMMTVERALNIMRKTGLPTHRLPSKVFIISVIEYLVIIREI